ncbi:MAG: 50S ribosomal protein L13 [Candidatus Paceibacterota bacterium]
MEYTIDCKGRSLGRVASEVASILQGKRDPSYEPRLVGDDTVVIKNVDQIKLTGNKGQQKIYYSHTTQLGHLKERKIKDVIQKHGMKFILKKSIVNMLPKNKLRVERIKKMSFE